MGEGDLQPGGLADRLLTGLGPSTLNKKVVSAVLVP